MEFTFWFIQDGWLKPIIVIKKLNQTLNQEMLKVIAVV